MSLPQRLLRGTGAQRVAESPPPSRRDWGECLPGAERGSLLGLHRRQVGEEGELAVEPERGRRRFSLRPRRNHRLLSRRAPQGKSAQEERGPPAAAGAPVLKGWKETEAAPAKKALAEQPAKPVLMTTYLDPAVHKCATVCMACATVDSTVTALVSASLRTLAPAATSPSLNVQPCSARKIPDAHLPVKTKQNWNANAFPITKATAKSASPSTPVCKTSATLMLIARTWDQTGTAAPVKNSTMGMATCAYP